jgi:hypothetical protein
LKKSLILILVSVIFLSTTALAQTRRRPAPRRKAPVVKPPTAQQLADLRAGRERIASQIKTLSNFLYLYGAIAKGIESADQASRSGEASSVATQQNERTKVRVRESIKNVSDGLNKLETDFRFNAAWRTYYPNISGVALLGETAETQAAANRFDEAGRSLLQAVNKLADALTTMR